MDCVFYLSTCQTCQRILKDLPNLLMRYDLKTNALSEEQCDNLAIMAGSYQVLLSKKAKLYQSMGLKNQSLSEADYRRLLLSHYTFLRRPVFVLGEHIFIGNHFSVINQVKTILCQ